MTVIVAVATADGLVIAADSRTTVSAAGRPTRVVSDYTHKVFECGSCAIGTYGEAFLGVRNIAAHVGDFVQQLPPEYEVDRVAADLATFIGPAVDADIASEGTTLAPGQDVLGFLVAGYQGALGKVYEVGLPSRTVTQALDSDQGQGALWRGQTDVIRRLVKGVDFEELLPLETTAQQEAYDELRPLFGGLEYIIKFESMNLQDAIDFATFAIRTTIDTRRLTHGTFGKPGSWPSVGGPIEIAAVRHGRGFTWVQRTQLRGERV